MTFKPSYANHSGHLVYLDKYYPWLGGNNPKFNQFSGQVLDLKDKTATARRTTAVKLFGARLEEMLSKGIALAVVPSHDPKHTASGIKQLAKYLAARGRHDATSCLVRFEKVDKLASGGHRAERVHLQSIRVDNPHLVHETKVVVLDDVTTSGNSLSACAKLLKRAGAASVERIAIGITSYD